MCAVGTHGEDCRRVQGAAWRSVVQRACGCAGGHGRGERTHPQCRANGACGPPRFASKAGERVGQSPSHMHRGVGAAAGPRAAGAHPSHCVCRVAWQTQPQPPAGMDRIEPHCRWLARDSWEARLCVMNDGCEELHSPFPGLGLLAWRAGAALSSFICGGGQAAQREGGLMLACSSVAADGGGLVAPALPRATTLRCSGGSDDGRGGVGVDCRALHRFGRPFRP